MDRPVKAPAVFRFTAIERQLLVAGWKKRPAVFLQALIDAAEDELKDWFDADRKPVPQLERAALVERLADIEKQCDSLGGLLNRLPLRDWESLGYELRQRATQQNIETTATPLNDLAGLLSALVGAARNMAPATKKGPNQSFPHLVLVGLVWNMMEATQGDLAALREPGFAAFLVQLSQILWPEKPNNQFGPSLLSDVLSPYTQKS